MQLRVFITEFLNDNGIKNYNGFNYIIPGDINNDNVTNVVDVVILVNYILGYQDLSITQINQADMDNNNLVNIVDVVLIIEGII